MSHSNRAFMTIALASLLSRGATAQSRPLPDLASATLEDLMNIEITSVSRKEERAADAPAAVFVITHDDIVRSGMTTLPDLLRLAPGVDVAQVNSNKWAVSIRGFNGLNANKLLVLIDGRSVYNRLFSGVLWDEHDVMIDDIDRIEVVRGPGGSTWGANAVNGVINVVTKSAADTPGALVRVEAGGAGEQGAARYGGTVGAAHYRVFAQWTERNQSLFAPDIPADDASHSVTAGFRTDWEAQRGTFMLDGAFTTGQQRALLPNLDPQAAQRDPIANDPSDTWGGHLVGRWTYTRSNGASLQVQSFLDVADRREPVGDYRRRAADVDLQYHASLSRHQDVVVGAAYRFVNEAFDGHVGFSLTPAQSDLSLVSAFVQDEIALAHNQLAVRLGSQAQYDSDSGSGVQPTAQVMWKGFPRQRLWASVSKALRTPSLEDRGLRLDFPPMPTAGGLPVAVTALGNPDAETERFVNSNVGYRLELGTAASIDVTAFAGRYSQLQSRELGEPTVQFVPFPLVHVTSQAANLLSASTRGVELAGHWMPAPAWRFDGSYSTFHLTPHPSEASHDPAGPLEDGSAPGTQWQLRALFIPSARAAVNVAIFHTGRLDQLQVDAYTRCDLNAEWRLTDRLAVSAIGQHLCAATHFEFGGQSLVAVTQVSRSASVRLRWTMR